MPNARDALASAKHKILALGPAGAGKSTQIWSLPGKKFAYFFDPNAVRAVAGLDLDYELFLQDAIGLDLAAKGFSKDSRPNDRPTGGTKNSAPEPETFQRWEKDFNDRVRAGFFRTIDWLIIDSLTTFTDILLDRHLWINKRLGDVEEQGDLKVLGVQLSNIMRAILGEDVNVYCTGHLDTFQDEKTRRIETLLRAPGRSRKKLPLLFTDIWEMRRAEAAAEKSPARYTMLTRSDPKGFQDIRTSLMGIAEVEDVTIADFTKPTNFGIGKLLATAKPRVPVSALATAAAAAAAATSKPAPGSSTPAVPPASPSPPANAPLAKTP